MGKGEPWHKPKWFYTAGLKNLIKIVLNVKVPGITNYVTGDRILSAGIDIENDLPGNRFTLNFKKK